MRLVACAFGLQPGLRYLSPEDHRDVYNRLGLKVRVAPYGALEIEEALDANSLPTEARHASRVARLVEEDLEVARAV
jgi:hypothetical protein